MHSVLYCVAGAEVHWLFESHGRGLAPPSMAKAQQSCAWVVVCAVLLCVHGDIWLLLLPVSMDARASCSAQRRSCDNASQA